MSYSVLESDGVMRCSLTTVNLDAGYCMQHSSAIREEVKVELPVVLDLSHVEFADSAGLGLIRSLSSQLGDRLRLANVGTRMQKCLSKIPIDHLPAICDDLAPPQDKADVSRQTESASSSVAS